MKPIEATLVLGFIWGFLVFLFLLFYLMGEMKGSQFTAISALSVLSLLIVSLYTLGPETLFLYLGAVFAVTFFTLIGYHFEKSK